MKYNTFKKIYDTALEIEYNNLYPKPDISLSDYIKQEYLEHLKDFEPYKQKQYVEDMKKYLETNEKKIWNSKQ